MAPDKDPIDPADFVSLEVGRGGWEITIYTIEGDAVVIATVPGRLKAARIVADIKRVFATWVA